MNRFRVWPWTFCRVTKSKGIALRFAASNHSLRSVFSGLRIGTLFPNPTAGKSVAINVLAFVDAVISLNPKTQFDLEVQPHSDAGTQY